MIPGKFIPSRNLGTDKHKIIHSKAPVNNIIKTGCISIKIKSFSACSLECSSRQKIFERYPESPDNSGQAVTPDQTHRAFFYSFPDETRLIENN